MKSILRLVIAVVVVLGILAFMTTYTVRFTEKAVVTTFGKASTVVTEPGLGFKWPYPIQSVVKYDTRKRFVETRPETVQTADNKQVLITAFVTYHIEDPLKFFQTWGGQGSRAIDHFRASDASVLAQLRAAVAQTSNFKLTEILNMEGGGVKLRELEDAILKSLQNNPAGRALSEQGITATSVGISSLRLPQSTTTEIFEAMKQGRTKLATEAASAGTATATYVRNQSEQNANKIMAFAQARAAAIRAKGDNEAAAYYKQMQNTELAAFQRQLDFMRNVVSKQFTLVLSPSQTGMGLFNVDVGSLLQQGKLPPVSGAGPSLPPGGRSSNERGAGAGEQPGGSGTTATIGARGESTTGVGEGPR